MNYESIILELLSRVQELEKRVTQLESTSEYSPLEKETRRKTKVTNEMINMCYEYSKIAFEQKNIDLQEMSKKISDETGMNINTAYMYLLSMVDILNGVGYNRILSADTLDLCLQYIIRDYGKSGLIKALNATKEHIAYLKSINNPANKLSGIYNKYYEML